MEDKENRQKTVVAFIAGLLIGGILVYIFAAMPSKKTTEVVDDTNGTALMDGKESLATKTTETANTNSTPVSDVVTRPTVTAEREGSVSVDDQPAGAVVTLSKLVMPANEGWVVVHDVAADGSLGRALGAARFNEQDGLIPTRIELLRQTAANTTYQVVIYSENGDKVFDFKDDKAVATSDGKRLEDSFKAIGGGAS